MRILRLPLLCVREVIENLNLFELYNFSLLSERARVIAKLEKFPTPKKGIISTDKGFSFFIEYSAFVHWHFKFTGNERQSENLRDDPCRKTVKSESRTYFFQDPVQGGLQFADFLIQTFNVSLTDFYLDLSEANDPNDLIRIIEWINTQSELKIAKTTIITKTNDLLSIVVQRYQKKSKVCHIWPSFGDEKLDPTVIFSPNLELDELYVPEFSTHGMSLKLLLSANFPKIDMGGQSMSCQDINTFLNSWKNGKTNSKLKYCELKMNGRIDMKAIFKGLKPIVHNPNTTKIVDRYMGRKRCVYSGIGIRSIDGKHAELNLTTYWLKEGEDAEIHQEVVDEFENSENLKEEVEKDEISQEQGQRRWDIRIEIE